jgi:hypothetical protein
MSSTQTAPPRAQESESHQQGSAQAGSTAGQVMSGRRHCLLQGGQQAVHRAARSEQDDGSEDADAQWQTSGGLQWALPDHKLRFHVSTARPTGVSSSTAHNLAQAIVGQGLPSCPWTADEPFITPDSRTGPCTQASRLHRRLVLTCRNTPWKNSHLNQFQCRAVNTHLLPNLE